MNQCKCYQFFFGNCCFSIKFFCSIFIVNMEEIMHLLKYQTGIQRGKTFFTKKRVCTISCTSGKIWITFPCSGDTVLSAGGTLNVDSGNVCIMAFEDSEITVTEQSHRFFPFSFKKEREKLSSSKKRNFASVQ